jgi:cytochrome c553
MKRLLILPSSQEKATEITMRALVQHTNGKLVEPTPGDQQPVMTVFGRPPALIRIESDELMHCAQSLVNTLGQCWVITPTRCILASPQTTIFPQTTAEMNAAMTQESRSVNQNIDPTICARCHGTGSTSRGKCPICAGMGRVRA